MSGQEAFNHCPQCHAFLQTTENAHRSFCKHCRFPLMLIANKYRLVEQLGMGSTATIYLAHHTGLIEDRERVIKVIKPETLDSETARLRFQREIQVTIALSRRNEHIVGIYDDFGEEPNLGHYYIMEYLQGRALQDMMFQGEPLGNWLTFRIFFQLCKAIGAAHRAGIVHRDLKPENILLVERDIESYFLKLIDFGIAKPLRRKLDLVVTQGALGTPAYMSPEQCVNKPVDGRSDIYAMGALLYELLTGHQPFVSPDGEELTHDSMLYLLEAHVKQKPRSMREAFPTLKIPVGLDQVVLKTLAKDPELRYQRVEDFWAALSAFAPPAYQQLELASQTALPAIQKPSASSQPPSEGASGTFSATSLDQKGLNNVKERIARFQSTPMPEEPSQSDEARIVTRVPATRAPASRPSGERPLSTSSSSSLPVATTRSHRAATSPPPSRRSQGIQEILPSSDSLPALNTFSPPALEPAAGTAPKAATIPAALQGPAIVPETPREEPLASTQEAPLSHEEPPSHGTVDAAPAATAPSAAQGSPADEALDMREDDEPAEVVAVLGVAVDAAEVAEVIEAAEASSIAKAESARAESARAAGSAAGIAAKAVTETPTSAEEARIRAAEIAEAALLIPLVGDVDADPDVDPDDDDDTMPALRAPMAVRPGTPDNAEAVKAVKAVEIVEAVTAAKVAETIEAIEATDTEAEAPAATPAPAGEDQISAAIADVIASDPAPLPVMPGPASVPAPAAGLRLERPKKALRRKALMESQATVEQSFFSPEQLKALAQEVRDSTAAAKGDHESGDVPPATTKGAGDTQEEDLAAPTEDLAEHLSAPPQAAWFKAPK